MVNAIPYLGKSTHSNSLPFFVKEITKPIHGFHRNITMDNWFTSVHLADEILTPNFGLTMVGTIYTNKREIPTVQNSRTREVGATIFAFDKEKMLASFKPKQEKVVLLLSTMHEKIELNDVTKKPKVIDTIMQPKEQWIHWIRCAIMCLVDKKVASEHHFHKCICDILHQSCKEQPLS